MAKSHSKSKSIKLVLIYFLSLLVFFILVISSFSWSKMSDDKTLVVKISETGIIDIDSYEILIHDIICDSTKVDKVKEITQSIESHPYVMAARVSMHYPSEIRVEIVERKPIAIININPMLMLDESGFVLPDLGNLHKHDLPIMSNFNTDEKLYPTGEKVLSSKVVECISLMSELKNEYEALYNNLSEMKISSSNEIELILSDQPTKIFLGSSNIISRINILKEFEKELRPKVISRFSYLDVRYNNQVIAGRLHS